jgi:glycogen synthase
MKLLIYSNFFMPHPGGTQTIVLHLAQGYANWHETHPGSDRIDVTVATQTREPWSEDSRVSYRVVRGPGLGELWQLIQAADLVHLAGAALWPLILCVLMRKHFVVEHHAFQVICPNGQYFYEPAQSLCPGHFMAGHYGECFRCNRPAMGAKNSAAQIPLSGLRRWLCNRANVNILPSAWLGTLVQLNRMRTIHHGIPRSSVASATPNAALASNFGFQGRLVSTKGIRVLLDAVGQLHRENRNFKLKIIGSGPQIESLKAGFAHSGANVEFLGHVPDEHLPDALAGVSTIIMPSLAGEVFGLVAAENMLRGKLVIVSDLGSLKEVVGDAGLVFRNGDAADLALRMKQVLDDPSLVSTLGAAAHHRVSTVFDLNAMIENHVQIYRTVVTP